MGMQTFPPALRIARSVATVTGADNALEAINTTKLSDRAVVEVTSNNSQYVLVNAMGATEWYGSNVNADAFSEASLIHKPPSWANNPSPAAWARPMALVDGCELIVGKKVVAYVTKQGLVHAVGLQIGFATLDIEYLDQPDFCLDPTGVWR